MLFFSIPRYNNNNSPSDQCGFLVKAFDRIYHHLREDGANFCYGAYVLPAHLRLIVWEPLISKENAY